MCSSDLKAFNDSRVAACIADLDTDLAKLEHLTYITSYQYDNNETMYLAAMIYYRLLKSGSLNDDDIIDVIRLAVSINDTDIVYIDIEAASSLLSRLDYDLYLPICNQELLTRLAKLLNIV